MKKYDSVYSILLDILTAVQEGGGTPGTGVAIIDELTSDRTNAALSANQGRVLKGLIDGISNNTSDFETRIAALEALTQQHTNEINTASDRLTAVEDDINGAVSIADQINGEVI